MKKLIPIPNQLKHLQQDRLNRPVPFIVLVDNNGEPNFRINDTRKVEHCLKGNLCAICGLTMPSSDMWLIGGEQSAFHPNGVYIDTPQHKVCGEFALQYCPYLASANYRYIDPIKQLSKLDSDMKLFVDPTVDTKRVRFFVFVQIKSFTVRRNNPLERYIIPERPYLSTEFWKEGKRIKASEAATLSNLSLLDQKLA